jgi:membrane-bound inhibitor of C-type lysozyme
MPPRASASTGTTSWLSLSGTVANADPQAHNLIVRIAALAFLLLAYLDGSAITASPQNSSSPQKPNTTAKAVQFACDDGSTLSIEFTSVAGGTGQAKVTHGGSTWVLPQSRSGSGARYAANGVSVWNKGNEVAFEDGKITRACRVAAAPALAGSSWRLVEIQSSDDRIGTARPDDPVKYTLALGADGRASLRLNCNRGTGAWSSTPTGADSGSFSLGPLAVTKAFCPPPSLDDRIARDSQYIRTYLLRNGRLYLNLMADGGTYIWEDASR